MIKVHPLALPHFDYIHYVLIRFLCFLQLDYTLLFGNELCIADLFEVDIKRAETQGTVILLIEIDFFTVRCLNIETHS